MSRKSTFFALLRMNYKEIISELRQGVFRPVYFLMGDEPYFIDRISGIIEHHALPEDQRSFNQSVFYGSDIDVPTLIAEARRYPMMAERVVIIVREAQRMRQIEELASYVENPLESTVLVICYKYKKLDKRKKLYKSLSNRFVVLESKKLYENEVPAWIGQSLKERGLASTPEAQQLLAEYLGTDLGRIDQELGKLELVMEAGQAVDARAVEENVGISKDYNNFELTKALALGDYAKAFRIQQYFEANPKDNPLVMTMSILYAFFSKLMIVHQAKDKTPRGLSGLLGVNPYFVKDYQQGAARYDMKKLARIIGYLRECDRRSKGIGSTNAVTDSEHLKELLVKIVHA